MKKTYFVLFALIVIFVSLSGCDKEIRPQQGSTATPSPIETDTAVSTLTIPTPTEQTHGVDLGDLEGLQIHFMHPWAGSTQAVLFEMVDQFNQFNEWGIHVIMNPAGSASQLEQKVWQGIQNQDAPNVIVAPGDLLLAIDEEKDLVVDLNQYVNSGNLGMSAEAINDFDQRFWTEDLVSGKRYGIPAQRTAAVLIYNLTWAQELGFSSLPTTPTEFKEQVCAANQSKRKDGDPTDDGIGGMLISHESASLLSWMQGFDARIHESGVFSFNSPESQAAFQFLLELKNDSCAWSGKTPQPYEYFASRKTLVYSGEMQDLLMQFAANQRLGSKDEWAAIPYPSTEKQTVMTTGSSYGILASSPEHDLAAWLFIRWLSEPAQQARLLQTFITLPLGEEVLPSIKLSSAVPPIWWGFVEGQYDYASLPPAADWAVIKPVLEDAAWQLFKTEIKPEQVSAILKQVDELVIELSERYP